MDWISCTEIEQIPGEMDGQPVIKGTRIRAQTIIDNFEAGSPIEEIAENYPSVPVGRIRKLIDYALSRQPQPR